MLGMNEVGYIEMPVTAGSLMSTATCFEPGAKALPARFAPDMTTLYVPSGAVLSPPSFPSQTKVKESLFPVQFWTVVPEASFLTFEDVCSGSDLS